MGLFRRKKADRFTATLSHVNGLPLAENTICQLNVVSDKLTIVSGSSEFKLNLDQLRAADYKMDVEISQIVESSALKGMAGGLLFGPVGAIIGSMPGSKEKRAVTGYLILNYLRSNGELASLLFSDEAKSLEAARFIDNLRPLLPVLEKQTYEL
ncbi:hypothetical protein P4H71_09005 [Paenibacillus kribbensis]|uniref:hypothetical protein n=1 Tax=Paenibacillus kribbensis TaxID=172713 RepID=UPI002DB6852B|nr:hypothetical protein [Paenibacillus kribbensis]MEC0234463.1 hypothetical protein [Paenibacillus kribbensis]